MQREDALQQLSITDYVKNLPRQEIISIKDPSRPSEITLNLSMYYDDCPLKNDDWSMQLLVSLANIELQYFQQQFMRIISYFTNRFIWALTYSTPYPEVESPKKNLTEE